MMSHCFQPVGDSRALAGSERTLASPRAAASSSCASISQLSSFLIATWPDAADVEAIFERYP
jgi:hypothetical protein